MRSVSSTVGPCGRCTIGTSTAACAGSRPVMRGSRRSSGAQAGGEAKRERSACAVSCCSATAGSPSAVPPPTTGTLRGSNGGSIVGTTALTGSEVAEDMDGAALEAVK